MNLIFMDDQLIIVDKPTGLPSHVTLDPRRPHLMGELEKNLATRPGSLILVHRLDAGTSGLVLVAKSKAAAAELSRQFRSREVEKIYLAVVAASGSGPPKEWRVENHLAADKKGLMRVVRAGGDFAATQFRTLGTKSGRSFIEARPSTGRKHQIRVHLADSGFAILGDGIYGVAQTAPRLLLHAHRLRFTHPVTGKQLEFISPVPPEFRI